MGVFGLVIHTRSRWGNTLCDTLLLPPQEQVFLGFSVWCEVQHGELKTCISLLS